MSIRYILGREISTLKLNNPKGYQLFCALGTPLDHYTQSSRGSSNCLDRLNEGFSPSCVKKMPQKIPPPHHLLPTTQPVSCPCSKHQSLEQRSLTGNFILLLPTSARKPPAIADLYDLVYRNDADGRCDDAENDADDELVCASGRSHSFARQRESR